MATVLTIRPGVSVRPGVTLLGKGPVIDLNPNLFPTLNWQSRRNINNNNLIPLKQ